MLKVALQMIGSHDEAIEELSRQIDSCMEPFEEVSERLKTIPGVKKLH